jgi:hypothetical protein
VPERLSKKVDWTIVGLSMFSSAVGPGLAVQLKLDSTAAIVGFQLLVYVAANLFVRLLRHLSSIWRESSALTNPPKSAAFLMFLAFPRQHREATIGDLDEDFYTNVFPRFGPVGASIWYSYKALLCIALYFHNTVVRPMLEKPYCRRVLSPCLKYCAAPLFVAHKLGWIDRLAAILRAYSPR